MGVDDPLVTEKATPLLFTPPTVTTMLPVVAPAGTRNEIEVSLQLVAVALVPFTATVLDPWLAPKPLPAMVTVESTAPHVGEILMMLGPTLPFHVATRPAHVALLLMLKLLLMVEVEFRTWFCA